MLLSLPLIALNSVSLHGSLVLYSCEYVHPRAGTLSSASSWYILSIVLIRRALLNIWSYQNDYHICDQSRERSHLSEESSRGASPTTIGATSGVTGDALQCVREHNTRQCFCAATIQNILRRQDTLNQQGMACKTHRLSVQVSLRYGSMVVISFVRGNDSRSSSLRL